MNAHEQTNAALARWLGWRQKTTTHQVRWIYEGKWYGYTNMPSHHKYFNPMQRIDHAWLLVEHLKKIDNDEQKYMARFGWFSVTAMLYAKPAPDAARAICEAIIEIAGIEV